MEFDFRQLIGVMLKRLWLIILVPVFTAGAAGALSLYVIKPVYEVDTTLYVINSRTAGNETPIAYTDILAGQQLVKDYRELIKSRTIAKEVIQALNLAGFTPQSLAKKINVNLKNDTRIIEIRVRDRSPETAEKIANQLASTFKKRVMEWMEVENVNIVDPAEKSDSQVEPQVFKNIAIAVFLGLMLSLGIVFLIEYFDDTLNANDDVEGRTGLAVLAAIPLFTMK